MSRLKLFLPLLLFVVLALFLMRGLQLDPREMPSALIDKPLPEFQLGRLGTDTMVQRSEVIGKVTLFNVWATWCISCRMEHPYLKKLAAEGIPIVGINYKDESAAALKWLHDLGNPYLFNIEDSEGTLGLDMGVYGAPETYIVDAQGIIRYRHVGVINQRSWIGVLSPLYKDLVSKSGAR